jgi:bifunctional non-homologous end joining protein LigD
MARSQFATTRASRCSSARIKHEAVLFAFDLLELDGEDYRWRPLEMRKQALARLTANAPPGLQLVEHLHGDGTTIYEHACKLGCEGIVAKRIGARYQPGPRKVRLLDQGEESGGARRAAGA